MTTQQSLQTFAFHNNSARSSTVRTLTILKPRNLISREMIQHGHGCITSKLQRYNSNLGLLSPCSVIIFVIETSSVLALTCLTLLALSPSARFCNTNMLVIKRITDLVRHHGKQRGNDHCFLYYKLDLENTKLLSESTWCATHQFQR